MKPSMGGAETMWTENSAFRRERESQNVKFLFNIDASDRHRKLRLFSRRENPRFYIEQRS
jgi:hypothetical protein